MIGEPHGTKVTGEGGRSRTDTEQGAGRSVPLHTCVGTPGVKGHRDAGLRSSLRFSTVAEEPKSRTRTRVQLQVVLAPLVLHPPSSLHVSPSVFQEVCGSAAALHLNRHGNGPIKTRSVLVSDLTRPGVVAVSSGFSS